MIIGSWCLLAFAMLSYWWLPFFLDSHIKALLSTYIERTPFLLWKCCFIFLLKNTFEYLQQIVYVHCDDHWELDFW